MVLRAALVALLLVTPLPWVTAAGLPPVAAAPGADPSPPVPPATTGHRLGYAGADVPALAAVQPDTGADLPPPAVGTPAEDASARGGALVFVTRRPGHHDTDLRYRRPGAADAVPLIPDDFDDRHPRLSPDGTTVAFESDRGGQLDIWVVAVDGSGLRRVTDHPADDTWPTWSPSGGQLAFRSTRDDPAGDIHVVTPATGVTTRLAADPAADSQPDWSVTGVVAFTTTRFTPPGEAPVAELATVADTGGAVRRLVPGEQAAWSPDGSRLAFVTRAADPAGDIAVLVVATPATPAPTVAAGRPGRGETEPAWQDGTVLYTAVTGGDGTSDVWSSDAAGRDRRDHTDRPGADETEPAFSPDGRWLAYAEDAAADDGPSGTRIVVADADGRNPRPLTEARGSVHDRDPAWSPDGTRIAFSRTLRDESSRVLVVRVSDGAPLGGIDVPTALDGDDAEPAWSPDGTRIAFSRRARVRPRPPITPGPVDRRINPGTVSTVEQLIETPAIPPDPDVVLLVDTTGSMGPAIGTVRADLLDVVGAVRAVQPTAQFAVASFRDTDAGAELFRVRQNVTPDVAAVQRAVDDLAVGGGGDEPEAWVNALYEVSTGAIGFRPGSSRIVVLVGDAPSHDPSNGRSLTQAIGALDAAAVRVVAVDVAALDSEPSPPGCELGCVGQATRLVTATSGRLVTSANADEIPAAILSGLRNLAVTVTPTVRSCDPGLTVSFDPAGPTTVVGGDQVRYRQTMTLAPGAVPGTVLRCDVAYPLSPNPGGDGYLAPVTVRVNDPSFPLVTVDDVVPVPAAAGPTGAVVDYPATATAVDGTPLRTVCVPPSGSLFPIGRTTVTCTATDGAGRVGTDTALVTVVDPTTDGSTRVWEATLSSPAAAPAPGDPVPAVTVTVATQVDLSVRVGEPCPARRRDLAPAFSPDGRALAFAAAGVLCVVDPDGGGARTLVTGDRGHRAEDPAWSPDGALLAYGWAEGFEPVRRSIRTVPAGGGNPTVVVDTPGEAFQPAFRRLSAGLWLTATAEPQSTPVAPGSIAVTFTAQNLATMPAERVWLSADLPAQPVQAVPLGALAPLATATVTLRLPTTAALSGTVRGLVAGVFPIEVPAGARAQTDVEVLAPPTGPSPSPSVPPDRPPVVPPVVPPPVVPPPSPAVVTPVLRLDPDIGPPGFVTLAVGTGFPPGSTVRLAWAPGISAPTRAVAAADGTFRTQMLVFHRDQLGLRQLAATGTGFAPVATPFLVVPASLQPGDFVSRR